MAQSVDPGIGDCRRGSFCPDRRISEDSPPKLTSLNGSKATRVLEEKAVEPKTQDDQLTSSPTSLKICTVSSAFPETTKDVSRKRKNSENSPKTEKNQDLKPTYMAPQENNNYQKAKRQSWRRASMKETNHRKSLPPFHQGITELSRSISIDLAESKRLGCLLLSSFQFSAQKLEPFLRDIDGFSLDTFKAKVSSISEEFKNFTNRLEDDGTLQKCSEESKGCGGTVGAILTCPLEVVKTRLQSSSVTLYISEVQLNTMTGASVNRVARVSPGPLHCLKMILEKEGSRSLFRGLGPNLVGVAPSRAIYFAAYSNCKEKMNNVFDPDSTQVHMISAAMAGFTAITMTNPIWLIKTRLQLDARNRGEKRMSAFDCIRKVYQTDGLKGFYRGMSASYAGISETVIHFVIYESIKQKLLEHKTASNMEDEEDSTKEPSDFVGMMLAAATSKTCATSIAYPHEVVRTRLHEEGTKYRSFFQTLSLVVREEGYGSLYRGLTTHLVRQIPNTAIMMATYELVVYLLNG